MVREGWGLSSVQFSSASVSLDWTTSYLWCRLSAWAFGVLKKGNALTSFATWCEKNWMCAIVWLKIGLGKRTNLSGASSFNPCGEQPCKLWECPWRHKQLFEGLVLNMNLKTYCDAYLKYQLDELLNFVIWADLQIKCYCDLCFCCKSQRCKKDRCGDGNWMDEVMSLAFVIIAERKIALANILEFVWFLNSIRFWDFKSS